MADRIIKEVIVHCSATPPDMDVDATTIRQWHTDPPPKGNGWRDIGYHYVIKRDGTVEHGRPLDIQGAHCRGHNSHSVGICLVGGIDKDGSSEFNFTRDQAISLRGVIDRLQRELGQLKVVGHRDYDTHKDCPCFNASRWWNTGRWE